MAHYGTQPRFIEVAKPNQNGCVERGHGVLKKALKQALKLRRSTDFESVEAFNDCLQNIVERLNRRHRKRWLEEQKTLKRLPASLPATYTEMVASVSSWSLIQVRNNTLSVPSRLIGTQVKVRLYPETLGIYYKDKLVETLPRPIGRGNVVINYRHLIPSLVRKPGAFANYRYHEHMFPTLTFRKAYDSLKADRSPRADLEYLRILKLAADTMECEVESALQLHLEAKQTITHRAIEDLVAHKVAPQLPASTTPPMSLLPYDDLLSGETREQLRRAA